MSNTPIDRVQIPPQALLAHDHIVGLCEPGVEEITQEVNWRVRHRTVKYVGANIPADRVVVVDYEDLDSGETGIHEFTDMTAWLWVMTPRAEAEPPVHATAGAEAA